MGYFGKRLDQFDVEFEIKDIVDFGDRGPTGQAIRLNQGNREFSVFVDLVEAELIFADTNLRQRTKILRKRAKINQSA